MLICVFLARCFDETGGVLDQWRSASAQGRAEFRRMRWRRERERKKKKKSNEECVEIRSRESNLILMLDLRNLVAITSNAKRYAPGDLCKAARRSNSKVARLTTAGLKVRSPGGVKADERLACLCCSSPQSTKPNPSGGVYTSKMKLRSTSIFSFNKIKLIKRLKSVFYSRNKSWRSTLSRCLEDTLRNHRRAWIVASPISSSSSSSGSRNPRSCGPTPSN